MKPFAVKLKDESHLLGLAVSQAEVGELLEGAKLAIDLSSVDVGLWFKDSEGGRTFIQPRDSRIVLIVANSKEDIGTFLGVKLP
jgi:hypothetical protein